MHYHLEIIMPPTDDVKAVVAQIMAPFDENGEDQKHTFWDWYVIGGRWSGHKMLSRFPQDRINAFYASLNERKVTVSSLQAGKPTLQPPEQAAMVDQMWREAFPEFPGKQCPLFDHYTGDHGNVCCINEMPTDLECDRVIIAVRLDDGSIRAEYMVSGKIWNGVNYVKTTWDETVFGAMKENAGRLVGYGEAYRNRVTPAPDWLVVTVDYHS